MPEAFIQVPSIYPKLLELRQSKTAAFKSNKYWREDQKLRYYQVIGALHLMMLQRMVLGDATGLGKTATGIAAFTWLLEQDPTLKWLVVCQKSALFQWAEEVQKFTTGITARVIVNEYQGLTGQQARFLQYNQFKENIMIINYAPLLNEYEMIKQALGSNYMVTFDEVTAIKNRKAKTHVACSFIAESAKRVYGLSATIIKNGLEEVYGIYAVIVPGLFGKITRFRETYCQMKLMKLRINGVVRMIPQVVGYKNLKQFKQVLDPYFLLRKKEDVASELPKLISRKIILEMEPEQKSLYRESLAGIVYEEKVKQEYYEILDKMRNGDLSEKTKAKYESLRIKYDQFTTTEGKKRGKLAALTYCQMISNGPALLGHPGESSKDLEFERILVEELAAEKVLVFSRFKSGIPFLEVICERNHIGFEKITGDITSAHDRDRARLKFQNDPECKVMFITTAGSSSLNLQAASTIIFIDTPWSYGDLVQTIGRAQRIGSIQDHILLIHFVNKGTIDMRVMNRVTTKKNLSDEILGDTAKGALDFTSSDENVIDDLFGDLLKDAEHLDESL